jgi:hypothetical protein
VVVGGVFLIDVCRGRRLFVGERLLFFGAAGDLYSFFVRRGLMFTREGLVESNDLSLAVYDGYRVVS